MQRLYYLSFIREHFQHNNQMLFLVGPRQVGKTTIAKLYAEEYSEYVYLNWDAVKDRTLILEGQDFIEKLIPLAVLRPSKPLVIFDEIHKFKDWKNYLKGFYDLYKDRFHILVTGSARLDIHISGGDSMMGRYFICHIHPLSVTEISLNASELVPVSPEIHLPVRPSDLSNLYKFGGFPDPFLKSDEKFMQKWQNLRDRQLLYEDIQNLENIHEITQLEVLTTMLKNQVGQPFNRSHLSKKIQVSVPTISRWMNILERFYYCFSIRPWFSNVSRSMVKEPKIYLWDWSLIQDDGARFENFIASHLLKNINYWNDRGLEKYKLHFLKDKDQHEVDFIVTRNNEPWFLVEAKLSKSDRISENLKLFQSQTKATHAFQVVYNMDYVNANCFNHTEPIIVPASSFLSQLC